jgi:hypothetical protein
MRTSPHLLLAFGFLLALGLVLQVACGSSATRSQPDAPAVANEDGLAPGQGGASAGAGGGGGGNPGQGGAGALAGASGGSGGVSTSGSGGLAGGPASGGAAGTAGAGGTTSTNCYDSSGSIVASAKACAIDSDCVQVQLPSCCPGGLVIGLNKSAHCTFDVPGCAGTNCPPATMQAEDGNTVVSGNGRIQVGCFSGKCSTFVSWLDAGIAFDVRVDEPVLCDGLVCRTGERCCSQGCSVCVPEALDCSTVVCGQDGGGYASYPSDCIDSPSCTYTFCNSGRSCYRCSHSVLASPCTTISISATGERMFCCP